MYSQGPPNPKPKKKRNVGYRSRKRHAKPRHPAPLPTAGWGRDCEERAGRHRSVIRKASFLFACRPAMVNTCNQWPATICIYPAGNKKRSRSRSGPAGWRPCSMRRPCGHGRARLSEPDAERSVVANE
jgi:hypothetical protein